MPWPRRIRRLKGFLRRSRAEARFALRATISAVLAYEASSLLELTQGYWAVLTAILVMQTTVGASLEAGLWRLLGTLIGGAVGFLGAVAVLYGWLDDLLALALGVLLLAPLASGRPAFRIAPVTAVVVMLSDPAHTHALEAATHRAFNIGIGSLIAVVVALTVFPARAHAGLGPLAGQVLRQMALALRLALAQPPEPDAQRRVQDRIRLSLGKLEVLAREARHERSAFLTDAADPDALVRTLRRLRSDLVIVARAMQRPWPPTVRERLDQPLRALSRAVNSQMLGLAHAAAGQRAMPALDEVDRTRALYDEAFQAARAAGVTRVLPMEDLGGLFTLGFLFDQVRTELQQLAARLAELQRRKR